MNDNSLQQTQGQTGFLSEDVEELIKSEIGSQSDFPILGEESGQSDKIRDYYWVVDPLD